MSQCQVEVELKTYELNYLAKTLGLKRRKIWLVWEESDKSLRVRVRRQIYAISVSKRDI